MIRLQRVLELSALLSLFACGGGGGGGTPAVPPTNLVYSRTSAAWIVSLPETSGAPTYAGGASTFSVVPALPSGLSIDVHSGAIAGTPTAATPMTSYVVKASNSGGFTTTTLSIATSLAPRFAYVVNQTDSTITLFDEDASVGSLSDLGYLRAPSGQVGPEKMVVHPSGKFAYVPNMGSSNLSVYTVDPASGWLTPGIALAIGSGPHNLTLEPAGHFLYVTSQNSNQLQVFSINQATGALSLVQSISTGLQPSACAVDPEDRFLFVTLHGDPTTGQFSAIQSYLIDGPTGSVTAPVPATSLAGYQPTDVVVDPLRDHLYTTSEKFDYVIPMSFDGTTGALTLHTARVAGDRPVALSIDPTGRFVYSANQNAGTVSCFVISDTTTGGLSANPTNVTVGGSPTAIAADAGGRFLYVLSGTDLTAAQLSIDDVTGVVAPIESLGTRPAPSGLAFAKGTQKLVLVPKFVHAAAASSDEAPAYTIAQATGRLTELANPARTDPHPVSVASDPGHRWLYVANQTGETIDAFSIDASTGALASIGLPVAVNGTPTHLCVDPSGRFLYVSTKDVQAPNDGWVTAWSIDPSDGSISARDTHQVADLALWTCCDPAGSFLYVACKTTVQGGAKIARLAIDAVDGSLSLSGNPPAAAAGCVALGYHPKRRVLYSVLGTANSIVAFAADPVTGELSVIPGGAGNSGVSPSAIALAPDGRFAYVSYLDPAGTGHVTGFSVDAATGKLVVPGTQYASGLHPTDLAMDGAGRFLYVANSGSNDVSVFQSDPATGVLTVQPSAASGLEPNALVVTTVAQ